MGMALLQSPIREDRVESPRPWAVAPPGSKSICLADGRCARLQEC